MRRHGYTSLALVAITLCFAVASSGQESYVPFAAVLADTGVLRGGEIRGFYRVADDQVRVLVTEAELVPVRATPRHIVRVLTQLNPVGRVWEEHMIPVPVMSDVDWPLREDTTQLFADTLAVIIWKPGILAERYMLEFRLYAEGDRPAGRLVVPDHLVLRP
jgi:hypothetical protein